MKIAFFVRDWKERVDQDAVNRAMTAVYDGTHLPVFISYAGYLISADAYLEFVCSEQPQDDEDLDELVEFLCGPPNPESGYCTFPDKEDFAETGEVYELG